ncbi:transposable element Tcb1 transposase [Trichonephila clavipes]|nr:transposable element Tcb1 transposase [Trichonephila clavipes]
MWCVTTHGPTLYSSLDGMKCYWIHARSPLVLFDGTLNSARYISCVLRPVALSFIRVLRNAVFQQDNARLHGDDIVRTLPDTEKVRLLPWPARSPDLSPSENVWSMVAK